MPISMPMPMPNLVDSCVPKEDVLNGLRTDADFHADPPNGRALGGGGRTTMAQNLDATRYIGLPGYGPCQERLCRFGSGVACAPRRKASHDPRIVPGTAGHEKCSAMPRCELRARNRGPGRLKMEIMQLPSPDAPHRHGVLIGFGKFSFDLSA